MKYVKLSKIICVFGITVCFICVCFTIGNFGLERFLMYYTIISASILELTSIYKYGEMHINISEFHYH